MSETDLTYMTEVERTLSMQAMLEGCDTSQPLWVFAYGSLVWNPGIEHDARRCGTVHGYHRSLCLWSRVYRGTPEHPGLVLALDRGGCCKGVAFRIPAHQIKSQLAKLWAREMVTGAYEPRWLRFKPDTDSANGTTGHINNEPLPDSDAGNGGFVSAISFVINRNSSGYAGKLDRNTLLQTLRSASGKAGSSADYVIATARGLAEHGIADAQLVQLAAELA